MTSALVCVGHEMTGKERKLPDTKDDLSFTKQAYKNHRKPRQKHKPKNKKIKDFHGEETSRET